MKLVRKCIAICLKHKVFVGIIIIALTLRLIAINQSLWLDEAIGSYYAKNYTFTELITKLATHDNHPPLFYFLLKGWGGVFGWEDLTLRILPIIFGVGTVALVYLFSPLASLLLAIAPFHVYYSQEIRMYVPSAFFVLLLMLIFQKLLTSSRKMLHWFAFSILIVLLAFTDYVPWFIFPCFIVWAFYKKPNWEWFLNFVMMFTPLVVVFLLWLPVFTTQIAGGQWLLSTLPSWRSLAGGANIRELFLVWTKFIGGRISISPKLLYGLFLIFATIPFVLSLVSTIKNHKRTKPGMLFLFLILPMVLIFVFSTLTPAFNYFRLMFIYPLFILLVAKGLDSLKLKIRYVFFGLILVVDTISLIYFWVTPSMRREDWRGAVSYVESHASSTDLVLFANAEPFAPYFWYQNGIVSAKGGLNSISATNEDGRRVSKLTESVNSVYFFTYLEDLQDPNKIIKLSLSENGFKQKSSASFYNVGSIEHWTR